MSYVITKQPDGDISLGNLNGEYVSLSDSISDYAIGGYAIVSGEQVQNGASPSSINCDLWRILTVIPAGGENGYMPVWNPTTQRLQIFQSAGVEVSNGANLNPYTFYLLLVGN